MSSYFDKKDFQSIWQYALWLALLLWVISFIFHGYGGLEILFIWGALLWGFDAIPAAICTGGSIYFGIMLIAYYSFPVFSLIAIKKRRFIRLSFIIIVIIALFLILGITGYLKYLPGGCGKW